MYTFGWEEAGQLHIFVVCAAILSINWLLFCTVISFFFPSPLSTSPGSVVQPCNIAPISLYNSRLYYYDFFWFVFSFFFILCRVRRATARRWTVYLFNWVTGDWRVGGKSGPSSFFVANTSTFYPDSPINLSFSQSRRHRWPFPSFTRTVFSSWTFFVSWISLVSSIRLTLKKTTLPLYYNPPRPTYCECLRAPQLGLLS